MVPGIDLQKKLLLFTIINNDPILLWKTIETMWIFFQCKVVKEKQNYLDFSAIFLFPLDKEVLFFSENVGAE
jgi:hypothetical protein